MAKGSFKKIQNSDRCFYGPRKLLLTGFAAGVQAKFRTLLQTIGISGVELVWANEDQTETNIEALVQLPDDSGVGRPSSLPRAIIAAGITERELHSLITGCRKAGLKQVLWATLTPTSVTWQLDQLLGELAAEHAALSRKNRNGI